MNSPCLMSIIIPVYNVEDYLPACISSIVSGTSFADFEIILVDDGSKDGSPQLCDAYAQEDKRIRVIHKENGGASQSRNVGMQAAVGDYLLFIDSDDLIEAGSLEKIAAALQAEDTPDVIFLKAKSLFPDGTTAPYESYERDCLYQKSHGEVLAHLSSLSQLPVCVWEKIVKREVLFSHDIRFMEGVICEDVDFSIKLFLHAKTYDCFDFDFYYYRQNRENSVMNQSSERIFTDLLHIISDWARKSKAEYPDYEQIIYRFLAYQYCMLLPMYKRLPRGKQADARDAVHALSWLLKHSRDGRIRLIKMCEGFFGLDAAARLLVGYDTRKKRLERRKKVLR